MTIIDNRIFSGIVLKMNKFQRLLPLLMLGAAVLGCSFIFNDETPVAVRFQDTATLVVPPTSTPSPTPTPVSTTIPSVRIDYADRAFFNGDWDNALLSYQTVFVDGIGGDKSTDIQAAALLGIGRTRYKMGDYEEALKAFDQLAADFPESPLLGVASFAAALAYEGLAKYAEAAEAYNRYLQYRPGLIDSYVLEWQGDARIAAGDSLKAIDVYQSAINKPRLESTLHIDLKIAKAYAALGDHSTALIAYKDVYTRTTSDYTKAQLDFLIGRSYTMLGQLDEAYAAYLNAVEKYPLSYDSYQALIVLVEAGYPVSEFDRGLVDYYAGQYNLAIAAFDRYLMNYSENAGTAYYYKGLAYRALDNPEAAIASWDVLIHSYLADEYWEQAWGEKAFTQWAYLDRYSAAVDTLLAFVSDYPTHESAPANLFDAGRVAERAGEYAEAAEIWLRIPSEYPQSELVSRAIFLAGIAQYREGDFNPSLSTFEWSLNSSIDPEKNAGAYFWMAKTYQQLGDTLNAETFLMNAASEDPTGYYSERARDMLAGREAFEPPVMYDLAFDPEVEKAAAEAWMREVFNIPGDIDLSDLGPLRKDPRFVRGTELWTLGLYEMARAEFESLRGDIALSPMDNYRLANYLVEIGLYRAAIFAARQVLNLHDMNDAETMNAPVYFNHIRYGSYYKELVLPAADSYGFHPLFLFSVVRQESLFEGFVNSSAGARGLMQIMPATGESIVANTGWPPGYNSDDLYRPKVSIALGTDYLDTLRKYFDGDLYAMLAGYNAGPGNALTWLELADGDSDLFLEIIRYPETQNYIKGIYEVFSIYRRLYDRSP